MQQATKILPKQTSLFGEEKLMSFPEDSHVNHSQQRAKEKEQKITVSSGRKCLEQYGKFSPHGSAVRTCLAYLLSNQDWYLKGYALIWKMKGTKSSRLLFQLVPRVRPTEGIECGLLLTPTASESIQDIEKFKERMKKYPNGTTMPNLATQLNVMLPTIQTVQREHPDRVQNLIESGAQTLNSRKAGDLRPNSVMDAVNFYTQLLPTPRVNGQEGYETRAARKGHDIAMSYLESAIEYYGMIPTPATRDYKGTNSQEHLEKECGHHNQLPNHLKMNTGLKLQPAFAFWMMGFPENWTELPFQNGEQNL